MRGCSSSFTRALKDDQDLLLVPLARYADFLDPANSAGCANPILVDYHWHSKLRWLAFPEEILHQPGIFWDIPWFWWNSIDRIEAVLIIVDAPPELSTLHDGHIHEHWEFTPLPDGALRGDINSRVVEPISGDPDRYATQAKLIADLLEGRGIQHEVKRWNMEFRLVTVQKLEA